MNDSFFRQGHKLSCSYWTKETGFFFFFYLSSMLGLIMSKKFHEVGVICFSPAVPNMINE